MNSIGKLSVVLFSLLFAASSASATAVLQLIDNEGHFDQRSGTASVLTLSVNNTSGSFLGSPWSLAIAVGTNSTTALGIPDIDFDLTANAERPGSLTAIFSIDNLSYGAGLHTVSVSSLINAPYTSGILWQVCIDDGNVLTAQTTCSGYAGVESGSLELPNATVDGAFSLTIIGRLLDTSSTQLSVTAAQAVPEPGTLLLAGLALFVIAVLKRPKAD